MSNETEQGSTPVSPPVSETVSTSVSGVSGNVVDKATVDNAVVDKLYRPLHDLRVSVTDRCNFRCVYCMPKAVFDKDYKFLTRDQILSWDHIVDVVKASTPLGVRKIRLTGGEPLIRNDLEELIERISHVDGITDISMTTNAALLTRARAESLKAAGLKRINVSLDAMDDKTFRAMNDMNVDVASVLNGIDNAVAAGIDNVKINMVVKKGLNDHSILPMAKHFHGSGQTLRFIEFMDVGNSNSWDLTDVVTSRQIADKINKELPIEPVEANYRGEVAKRWRYADGGGEIGIISSVSEPFCGDCSRARLSATGSIYTCLFASEGHDLRSVLDKNDAQALQNHLRRIWEVREDRYSETRTQVVTLRPKVEMSFIGG